MANRKKTTTKEIIQFNIIQAKQQQQQQPHIVNKEQQY